MKMSGVGVRAWSWLAQLAVSVETKVVSLAWAAAAACGVRRDIVSTRLTAVLARRLVRMCDPYARCVCLVADLRWFAVFGGVLGLDSLPCLSIRLAPRLPLCLEFSSCEMKI